MRTGSDLPLSIAGASGVGYGQTGEIEGGMGAVVGDLAGDGRPAIFSTNFQKEPNRLYAAAGGGFFDDRTLISGLGFPSFERVSWGIGALDVEGDGEYPQRRGRHRMRLQRSRCVEARQLGVRVVGGHQAVHLVQTGLNRTGNQRALGGGQGRNVQLDRKGGPHRPAADLHGHRGRFGDEEPVDAEADEKETKGEEPKSVIQIAIETTIQEAIARAQKNSIKKAEEDRKEKERAEAAEVKRVEDETRAAAETQRQADLEAEMRRVALALGIGVAEDTWPDLVAAASFESMKKNADRMAPDTNFKMWKDNSKFFNKGTSGQWQGVLSAESLGLLDEVTAKFPADFIGWLFNSKGP